MAKKEKMILSPREYQEKKFQTARDILASIVSLDKLDNSDSKQRDSLIFYCQQMASSVLDDLGYAIGDPGSSKPLQSMDEGTTLRNIGDLLDREKKS